VPRPAAYPVNTTIVGSKAVHVVALPSGRTATLTLQTIPDEEPNPYRGYRNPLGYEGDRLVEAERRDRERHEEYNREFDAMRAGQRQAQADLVAKFASVNAAAITRRDVGMTTPVSTKPFKMSYTNKPWQPEPFGLGDWVVIDADGLTGQVTGRAHGELWVTATGPDGRTRDYCASGDAKTGRWERDGFRWTRSTDVLAVEHGI